MRRAAAPADYESKIHDLVERLSTLGQPILKAGLDAQLRVLGRDRIASRGRRGSRDYGILPPDSRILWGDIFVADAEYYAVAVRADPEGNPRSVGLYAITAGPTPSLLNEFADSIDKCFEVKLEPYFYTTSKFQEIQVEVQQAFSKPTPEEVALARVIADPNLRALAIAIKQAGGLLVSDLQKQLKSSPNADVAKIRQQMTSAGLTSSEVVVLCKSASRQVFRAPSSKQIKSMADAGIRCACGRSVDQERQEEAISLTERGVALLDKSRWLSILVYEELIAAGVPAERVIIEATLGGDEVDCIADISGEVALFELKDKEFSLGEAYSFGAKIGIIKPRHAVVVTSVGVGGDAKQHLKRALQSSDSSTHSVRWYGGEFEARDDRGSRVRYIEGVDNLREEIQSLVSSIEANDAKTVLQDVLGLRGLSPTDMIDHLTVTHTRKT